MSKGDYVRIWEQFMQTFVPKGCCIHHLDEDQNNNNILNLVCLTKQEHCRWHSTHRTIETLQKIGKASSLRTGNKHQNYGKESYFKNHKHSEQTKLIMSKKRKAYWENKRSEGKHEKNNDNKQ